MKFPANQNDQSQGIKLHSNGQFENLVRNPEQYVCCFTYDLNLARVGGFHMQDISGHSHSLLLQALNNAADGSLRLVQDSGAGQPLTGGN